MHGSFGDELANLNRIPVLMFPFRAKEVKEHAFFKDMDWKLVELLKVSDDENSLWNYFISWHCSVIPGETSPIPY